MSGYEIAALALAAGGTAASMSAQQEQASDRRKTLNRQMEANEKSTAKAVDLIQDEGKNFNPQSRIAQMLAAEQGAVASAQKDLGGAGGDLAVLQTAGDAGNVSSDFLKAKADRAISEGSRMTELSREFAKIRAPGQLQTDDELRKAKLAGELSNIQGSNANMARANSMDAESVEAPAYGQLGQIASALGGAYLASGAGRTAGSGGQIAWGGPAVGGATVAGSGGGSLIRGTPAIGFGRY